MTASLYDKQYMRSALALARTGLGRVAPNPAVGCVIVKKGIVVARARTADGGRPHAETRALDMAGSAARGATAYVTLEPCAHHGQTGPCAAALVNAGIARVVIACTDPDPRVAGKGVAYLKAAGVQVDEGVCAEEAAVINAGFFNRLQKGRPFITLKIASTLDAIVASASGQSQWITGPAARALGHLERSQHDAVAIGINSVLTDDPQLTTRLRGIVHHPVRIIFDTQLRIPDTAMILKDADVAPVWIVCGDKTDEARKNLLEKNGIKIITKNDLASVLHVFAQEGLTRVMVEGGAALVTSFIKEGLFDRLLWFRHASVLGQGKAAIGDLGIQDLADRVLLKPVGRRPAGDDMLEIFEARN